MGEAVEVVDVGRQQRHLDARRRRRTGRRTRRASPARPRGEARSSARLCHSARRAPVVRVGRVGRRRPRRRARRRTPGGPGWRRRRRGRCPGRRAGRRTTPPRRPSRGAATATSTNSVASARSSAITSSARWRNPPSIPANAWKKATASASTSEPTTLPIARSTGCVATLTIRMPGRAGSISSLNRRWSRKRASTPGRVEEVEGVAASAACRRRRGRSARRRASRCSVSAAMYSCVPLSDPAMLRKKRLATMRSACSASAA